MWFRNELSSLAEVSLYVDFNSEEVQSEINNRANSVELSPFYS